MDDPAENHISRYNSRLVILLFSLGLLMGSATVAADPPPQGGAVPLSQGVADLASQLAKGIPEGHTMTIAVTDFPDRRKQVCGLGQFVAERLSTLMSRHPQWRLIERRRLDMVLSELKFSMSELVDPTKARKLGQMLGVQGLVVGTVTDLGATFDVDARIIDIQTDVSLPGASASIVKDEAARQLSSDCGQAVSAPASGPQSASVLPPASGGIGPRGPQAVQKAVVEDIAFEVKSCEMSGTSVRCRLAMTNGSSEDQQVRIYTGGRRGGGSRMIDESGNEYVCQRVQFGTREASVGRFGLGAEVPSRFL
jgi:TolB-like protein